MNYEPAKDRYQKVDYQALGGTGLKLPQVSLGFWHNFGDTGNFETMRQMMHTAFDNGITHFDLANNYGPEGGAAERNVGKILKQDFAGHRDELIISTKAGYYMWPGPYGDGGSRKYLISSLDQSLERLGLPYVDIFYHHRMDPETPLEESMHALSDIVRSGKALYAGISNYDAKTSLKAMKIMEELGTPLVINQSRYSIFDRAAEKEGLVKLNQDGKLGLITFSPLAQGLLTDRYLDGIPADSRVRTDGRFLNEAKVTDKRIGQAKELREIARARGQSLAAMALAWILAENKATSVLIGASRPEQILDDLGALRNTIFTADELKQIDAISLR